MSEHDPVLAIPTNGRNEGDKLHLSKYGIVIAEYVLFYVIHVRGAVFGVLGGL